MESKKTEANSTTNYVPTYKITNDYASKLGATFDLVGARGFAVHTSLDNFEGVLRDYGLHKDKIHFIEENSILHDPELRRLINESNTTFVSSRSIHPDEDFRKAIVKLSWEHRSIIRQCIENMVTSMKENSKDNYIDWVDVLGSIDHIWHLCELLFIDCAPGDIILPKLLGWIRLHFSDNDFIAAEVLSESHTKGANHRYPNYWELVYSFLMEGRINAAQALLKLHSDADKSAYIEADKALQGMPKFNLSCGLSVPEFNSRWRGWKSSLQTKIKSGTFLIYPQLQEIMLIVVGGESSFSALKERCSTWYEMLVAYLLYNDQTVKIDDLGYHANNCVSEYGQRKSLKVSGLTLLALFEHNLPLAIQYLQLTADGGCCSLHLANLLELAGVLDGEEVNLERMFIRYGQLLISHQSYWQLAMTYFEQCPSGLSLIETALKSLPINSKEQALRMISIAKDYGLDDVAGGICRMLIAENKDIGNLAGALTWAIMSSDSDAASSIADLYLQKYALGETEHLVCSSVLANLGESVLISGRLTFLAKYCEFHNLHGEKKFKEAAQLLIRLLESKVAPKFFWLTLLIDSLPFLTLRPVLFSHDDITIIHACLEEVTSDVERANLETEPDDNIKLIREEIAKCFMITLLSESCEKPNLNVLKICD